MNNTSTICFPFQNIGHLSSNLVARIHTWLRVRDGFTSLGPHLRAEIRPRSGASRSSYGWSPRPEIGLAGALYPPRIFTISCAVPWLRRIRTGERDFLAERQLSVATRQRQRAKRKSRMAERVWSAKGSRFEPSTRGMSTLPVSGAMERYHTLVRCTELQQEQRRPS